MNEDKFLNLKNNEVEKIAKFTVKHFEDNYTNPVLLNELVDLLCETGQGEIFVEILQKYDIKCLRDEKTGEVFTTVPKE